MKLSSPPGFLSLNARDFSISSLKVTARQAVFHCVKNLSKASEAIEDLTETVEELEERLEVGCELTLKRISALASDGVPMGEGSNFFCEISVSQLVRIAAHACECLEQLGELAPDLVNQVAAERTNWPVIANVRHYKETKKRKEKTSFLVYDDPAITLGADLPVKVDSNLNPLQRTILSFVEWARAVQKGPEPVEPDLGDISQEDIESGMSLDAAMEIALEEYRARKSAYMLPPLVNEKTALREWVQAIFDDLRIPMLAEAETVRLGPDERFLWFNEKPFRGRTFSRILQKKRNKKAEAREDFERAERERRSEWNNLSEMYSDNLERREAQIERGVGSENTEESTVREVIRENLVRLLRK